MTSAWTHTDTHRQKYRVTHIHTHSLGETHKSTPSHTRSLSHTPFSYMPKWWCPHTPCWLTNAPACTHTPRYRKMHKVHTHTQTNRPKGDKHSCLWSPIKEWFLLQSLVSLCSQHTLAQFLSSFPLPPPPMTRHLHLLSSFTMSSPCPPSNWTAPVNRCGRYNWTNTMTQ